jgi:hypothetical protein
VHCRRLYLCSVGLCAVNRSALDTVARSQRSSVRAPKVITSSHHLRARARWNNRFQFIYASRQRAAFFPLRDSAGRRSFYVASESARAYARGYGPIPRRLDPCSDLLQRSQHKRPRGRGSSTHVFWVGPDVRSWPGFASTIRICRSTAGPGAVFECAFFEQSF